MQLIKGKEIADDILSNIKSKIEHLETKPTLAVILIGEDNASEIYVGLKGKAAREIGMNFKLYKYDSSVEENVILDKISEINADKSINGLIVQLPLPEKLDKYKIINAISFQKDVDGFCDNNQRCFFNNQETLFPVFPKAIIKLIESALINLETKDNRRAAIVCKSDDFGKIMQVALDKVGIEANYVLCDDLDNAGILKDADIVVTACGVRNLINVGMIKDGAIIIDGGIVKENGKVYGDIDLESFKETNCFISPVPGGVGPVTVACLLENVYLTWREL